MSNTDAIEKSVVVRVIQRRRYTDTNGRTTRRVIRFNGPVVTSGLAGMTVGEQVTLWIEETRQTEPAIGSMTPDKEDGEQLAREIQLRLPYAAFSDFWNAASSADSALRNITLKLEDEMMNLAITDVVLLEGTPVHPVVAELRFMWRPLRLLLIGLLATGTIVLLLEIVRVIWRSGTGGS